LESIRWASPARRREDRTAQSVGLGDRRAGVRDVATAPPHEDDVPDAAVDGLVGPALHGRDVRKVGDHLVHDHLAPRAVGEDPGVDAGVRRPVVGLTLVVLVDELGDVEGVHARDRLDEADHGVRALLDPVGGRPGGGRHGLEEQRCGAESVRERAGHGDRMAGDRGKRSR
jgi:hypothetical protein